MVSAEDVSKLGVEFELQELDVLGCDLEISRVD
jgi:hypothetical protein